MTIDQSTESGKTTSWDAIFERYEIDKHDELRNRELLCYAAWCCCLGSPRCNFSRNSLAA